MTQESIYRHKIKSNLEVLTKELEVQPLLPYLCQEDIITEYENERIEAEPTRHDKATKLLKILLSVRSEESRLKFVLKLQTSGFQPHLAQLISNTEIREDPLLDQESIESIRRKQMTKWSVDDVFVWLKSIQIEDPITREFRDEKISGDTLSSVSKADIESISSSSKFGDRDRIIKMRDTELVAYRERLQESEIKNTTKRAFVSEFKNFDCLRDNESPYGLPSYFPLASTALDNLIEPVHSYVELQEAGTVEQMLCCFSVEVVPFICACLNDRTNGTCHFGVKTDGEIVGVELKDGGGEQFQSRLNCLVESCFSPEQLDIVKNCVRRVRMVEVKPIGTKENATNLSVVEVDVVPAHTLCTDEAFFAKTVRREPPSSSSSSPSSSADLKFERGKVFRFENGKPVPFSDENLIKFMETKTKLAKLRRERELSTMMPRHITNTSDDQSKNLQALLCRGGQILDDNTFPIFVLSPMDENDETQEVNADFLNSIEKKAVFDFCDGASKLSIFCKHEENTDVPFDILSIEHFDSEKSENKAGCSAMSENRSSKARSWIFCNGIARTEDPTMSVFDWKRKRRRSFVKAVEYFDENIPREHAVVVFLIFSKNFEVMLCAIEEFCLKFGDNWLVICEDTGLAYAVRQQMKDTLKIIQSEREFEERSIVGMPWDEVSATILKAVEYISTGEVKLAMSSSSSTGTAVAIGKRFLFDLDDLEVLSSDHCSQSSVLNSEEKLRDLKAEKERRFYEGEEVDWWNFFFENQVIERDILDEIVKYAEGFLSAETEDPAECLSIVSIYHLPGSGATTLARHVLWKLKSKFRCAVVKYITSETAGQLGRLLAYEESRSPKPVLVLLDNFDETQVQTLKDSLEREVENLGKDIEDLPSIPFVLLECVRVSTEDSTNEKHDVLGRFEIGHCLSANELKEFGRKYDELEKSWREKSRNLDPRMLISFNILRENFNPDYIQRTVQGLVRLVTDYAERQLLKYISFIGAYDPDCHSTPASCFDSMMRQGKHKNNSTWLKDISRSLKTLINYDSKSQGMHLTKIRIIHNLLSREIYKEIVSDCKTTPADVMTEFLFRMIPKRKDAATRELLSIAYSLAIKRVRGSDGRYKSDFSPVIQSVIDDDTQDNSSAIQILKKTYKLTEHVVIVQHIARLYNYFHDWESAIHWITVAIDVSPNQEVFYNTYGNIFKEKLIHLFHDGVTAEKIESSIRLVKKAMEIFKKEQSVANVGNNNPSGLICEGNTILHFVEILKRFTQAEGLQVRDLLNSSEWFHGFSDETSAFIQSLLNRAEVLATELELIPQGSGINRQTNIYEEHILKVTERLRKCLGFDRNELVPSNYASTQGLEFRRSQLFAYGGNSLASMLKLNRQQDGQNPLLCIFALANENCKSPKKNMRDMQTLIGATLLLNLPLGQLNIDGRTVFTQLKRLTGELLSMSENSTPIRTQKETYLFYALMHWPTADSDQDRDSSAADCLRETVEKWKSVASDVENPSQRPNRHYIMFFLGTGDGIERVVLYHDKTKSTLAWFKGTVVKEGQYVKYSITRQNIIEIPFYKSQNRNRWMRDIYFTLGFSWFGPVACDTRVEDPRTPSHPYMLGRQEHSGISHRPPTRMPATQSGNPQHYASPQSRRQAGQRYPNTRWKSGNRMPNVGSRPNQPEHFHVDVSVPLRQHSPRFPSNPGIGFPNTFPPRYYNMYDPMAQRYPYLGQHRYP